MSNVIEFQKRQRDNDPYFGLCPDCGYSDGYFNYARDHYFKCDEHRAVWYVGSNLFSSWRDETQADWDRNAERHRDYREVKPIHSMKMTPGEYRCGRYLITVDAAGLPSWSLHEADESRLGRVKAFAAVGEASAFPEGVLYLHAPKDGGGSSIGSSQAEIDAYMGKLPVLDMGINDYALREPEPAVDENVADIPF